MTQKHVNDSQYKIYDPAYVDPSYNVKDFNTYLKVGGYDRTAPPNYLQQYVNDININSNYNYDIGLSTGLLKYLDSYKSDPNANNPNSAYKQRHIDVNKYYIMKYQSESYILKLIIFFCGLALIGSLFFLKGFINESLYILYLGIIISVAMITIVYNIYKLIYRDNTHFDEIDFGYMNDPGTDVNYPDISFDIVNPNLKIDKCV
uniref:Uncharacterized protein n=1 Tax=viral metagenome TaxID=1070528 RepID=A0A6C0D187_9ZZZZ